MSKPVLALGGARFDGLVRVTETGPQGMITLRGDLSAPQIQSAACDVTGVDFPGVREARTSGARGILWMSPDELMLLVPREGAAQMAADLAATLADSHALVADVSDARSHFTVQGKGLRDVLAKLAPVDMAPECFAVGSLRRTRFAQVPAGVWLPEETTAQIFCFRSVAQYMFDLLCAAADDNAAVGHFAR